MGPDILRLELSPKFIQALFLARARKARLKMSQLELELKLPEKGPALFHPYLDKLT